MLQLSLALLAPYLQTATSSNPCMKTLFLTIVTSIASGLALYYIVRTALVSLIWLFDVTLTNDQRLFVHELGFPTFVLGLVVGGVVFWRVQRKILLQDAY